MVHGSWFMVHGSWFMVVVAASLQVYEAMPESGIQVTSHSRFLIPNHQLLMTTMPAHGIATIYSAALLYFYAPRQPR